MQNARRDHFDFIDKMRDRDVEVLELHNVLTETMSDPVTKAWLLDRKIVPNEVGLGLVDDTRGFLDSLPPRKLAELLIGGMSTRDLPAEITSGYRALDGVSDAAAARHALHPRHHLLDLRRPHDESPGLGGPSRRDAVDEGDLRVPPRLVGSRVWWRDPEKSWGMATIEGGDVLVPGNGVVVMGMSERTSRQAITQV